MAMRPRSTYEHLRRHHNTLPRLDCRTTTRRSRRQCQPGYRRQPTSRHRQTRQGRVRGLGTHRAAAGTVDHWTVSTRGSWRHWRSSVEPDSWKNSPFTGTQFFLEVQIRLSYAHEDNFANKRPSDYGKTTLTRSIKIGPCIPRLRCAPSGHKIRCPRT